MASFTIAVASVSGSARAPRTASRAHRVAASRVPAGSLGRGSGVAARRAAAAAAATDRPVVLIDNYDSFTYNLSQVRSRRTSRGDASLANAIARLSSLHHAGPVPSHRSADLFFRLCRVSRTVALYDALFFFRPHMRRTTLTTVTHHPLQQNPFE